MPPRRPWGSRVLWTTPKTSSQTCDITKSTHSCVIPQHHTHVWYKLLQPVHNIYTPTHWCISSVKERIPPDSSWTTLKEQSHTVIYYKLKTPSHQIQASTFLYCLFNIYISINVLLNIVCREATIIKYTNISNWFLKMIYKYE